MEKHFVLVLTLLIAFSLPGGAEEGPQVDFILMIDTSLSMAPAMDDLKQYVTSGIIDRYVQKDDWVAVLTFYGETKLLWEGTVKDESDKASLIHSLQELDAKGRYTDIGTALDAMKQLVIQRNQPAIPKFILLLSDEVQEAPPGSSYHTNDFSIDHELLEYVRRVDMDSFQAITIGYGLGNRIENDLESVMRTLNDPPERPERFLPGATIDQVKGAELPGSEYGTTAEQGITADQAYLDGSVAANLDAESSGPDSSSDSSQNGIAPNSPVDPGSPESSLSTQEKGSQPGKSTNLIGAGLPVFPIAGSILVIALLGFMLVRARNATLWKKQTKVSRKPPAQEDETREPEVKDGGL